MLGEPGVTPLRSLPFDRHEAVPRAHKQSERSMHTIMVIAGGFLLLGLFLLAGRLFGGSAPDAIAAAAKYFVPLWLVAALVNMWVGVSRAGYTVVQEAPILLVVFVIPASVALGIWWRLSRR